MFPKINRRIGSKIIGCPAKIPFVCLCIAAHAKNRSALSSSKTYGNFFVPAFSTSCKKRIHAQRCFWHICVLSFMHFLLYLISSCCSVIHQNPFYLAGLRLSFPVLSVHFLLLQAVTRIIYLPSVPMLPFSR